MDGSGGLNLSGQQGLRNWREQGSTHIGIYGIVKTTHFRIEEEQAAAHRGTLPKLNLIHA